MWISFLVIMVIMVIMLKHGMNQRYGRSPPQLLEQIVMVDDASTADAPHLQVFLIKKQLAVFVTNGS